MFVARPHKILIVEDSLSTRMVLTHRLSERYTVDSCGALRTAKDKINREQYDAILFDLNLSDATPDETLAYIRTVSSNIPVVVFSSVADTDKDIDYRAIREYGAADYVHKKFTADMGRFIFERIDNSYFRHDFLRHNGRTGDGK